MYVVIRIVLAWCFLLTYIIGINYTIFINHEVNLLHRTWLKISAIAVEFVLGFSQAYHWTFPFPDPHPTDEFGVTLATTFVIGLAMGMFSQMIVVYEIYHWIRGTEHIFHHVK